MNKSLKFLLLSCLCMVLFLNGCSNNKHPSIDRYPPPAAQTELEIAKEKDLDTVMRDDKTINLVGYDLSKSDLMKYQKKLEIASFDTLTKWPNQLPKHFNPNKLLEMGKDPGINIRELHKQGITGKNVGIAIIDSTLLIEHKEYTDRIKQYHENNIYNNQIASYHGTAVASIAVGKSVGVAPNADLYYIAEGNMTLASALTKDILEIIQINKKLPKNKKIRVISISVGMNEDQDNYDDFIDAIEKAKQENIIVLSATESSYFYKYFDIGLDRKAYSNPNDINSYLPSHHRLEELYTYIDPNLNQSYLQVPMEARTVASHTGKNEYRYDAVAGASWSIPFVAGLFALCCQVDQDLSYEEFINKAQDTSIPLSIEHNGTVYVYGRIVQPKELIAAIQK